MIKKRSDRILNHYIEPFQAKLTGKDIGYMVDIGQE